MDITRTPKLDLAMSNASSTLTASGEAKPIFFVEKIKYI